jgi:NADH-quinone oxidoreductase subunit C
MVPESLRDVPLIATLEAALPGVVVSAGQDLGELTLEIASARIAEVCHFLRESGRFERLADLTAIDWHPRIPRFEVVYHLHSVENNQRLRLKCPLEAAAAEIDSVTGVWRRADWHEREVFDLFGIVFRNHPNLKRIMLPEDWDGHPLRKDYPVYGNKYGYKDE